MVSETTLNHIQVLAARSPHREVCGLVDTTGTVYPIINVSSVASDFVFSRSGYGRALRDIKNNSASVLCVYHSHVGTDVQPSAHDLLSMRRCKADYLIVSSCSSLHSYTECPNE